MAELLSSNAGTSIVPLFAIFSLINHPEICKEMITHLKKPYFHTLNVFIETYRPTSAGPLIGATATTSLIHSSETPSAPRAPLEDSTSVPAAKNDLATRISGLEPKIEEKRSGVEINKKYVELGDALIKSLHGSNEAVVELYDDMIETYNIALERNALSVQGVFSKIFEEILRVSQECAMFLSGFLSRSCLKTLVNPQSSKFTEFKTAFNQLRGKFRDSQLKVTTVTVLNTKTVLDFMALNTRLKSLKPSKDILPPKSLCSPGTRRESLTKISNWIFHKDQSVLWISGIAGCGKSSLIGTLHRELLTWGNKGPLAAFIRFDRSTYNLAAEFIKALAFQLAKFDSRLGEKIAEAIERRPSIINTPDLDDQAQQLIIDPLEDSEIASEGRIVVLVDGIDECARLDQPETNFREQLLALFASDKFRRLVFLRFVLASRPEEDILSYLQGYGHIHHFPLDCTSSETKHDIYYFLAKSFQRPCFNGLDDDRKHDAVERLLEHASGLFIWAATAVTFIGENVEQRLKDFLAQDPPKNALQALTNLYEIALESLVKEGDNDIQQNICTALGLIMANANSSESIPCSVDVLHALTKYVNLENNTGILSAFQKLRSLVTKENGRYQLLHKSFDDFLTSEDRARRWYIDIKKYDVILAEAILTCMMDHLDKTDTELPEALSSDVYRYASGDWLALHASASYQQKEGAFLPRYVLRWMRSLDHEFSGEDWYAPQRIFGNLLTENGHHDSEFMQKAITGASRLQQIGAHPIVIKDFFNIMLYDAALAGKVTKTNTDGQYTLEWEIDNIYMSIFILMAGGSNIYEEIVAVLDTNPIPPVVPWDPETVMPIKIISRGKVRMNHRSVRNGDEESTKEFIEWILRRYGRHEGIFRRIPDEVEEEDSEP
ncbi:hypothetical protein VNI00_018388 [Paramarasmius palmivorus]|uniref:Nephrocystin 3-like N-terminal domain-containing protein n=1 Tax=Paramarasmius palmivorus TaxID=297713 RepID=A0AAW0AZC2_9AGAR